MIRSRVVAVTAAVAIVASLIQVGPGASPAGSAPVGTIETFMGSGNRLPGPDCIPATSTSITTPVGLAVDAQGGVVFADQTTDRVGRLIPSGYALRVAGTGAGGTAGDGGPAVKAEVDAPSGVAVDSQGRTYIADWGNNRVRRIDPATGEISTFASLFGGQPIQAYGVAVDASDNVYIAASGNHRVLKATPAGVISPFAGTGVAGSTGDGGQAASAQVNAPADVAVDAAGNVYIVEFGGARVRKVTPGGVISTIAGTGVAGSSGDGGPATAAQLNTPNGVAADSAGNVIVADFGNHRVRRIVAATNTITTIAGTGAASYNGDGGVATAAALDAPTSVEVDVQGTVYIADSGNHRVRKIAAGVIATVVGNGSAGSTRLCHPLDVNLGEPVGVAVDPAGNVYVADYGHERVRRVTPEGVVSTFAGGGTGTGDGIAATAALIALPMGLAFAPDGDLLIADADSDRVRRVDSVTSVITTLAGNATPGSAGDGGPATAAQLTFPTDVSVDTQGNTYIADSGNNKIRRVTPGGVITTFAGTGSPGSAGDGGPATAAQLAQPLGVHAAESGVVYVADTDNHKVRRILGGTITTAVGTGAIGSSGDGGPPENAKLSVPWDVITDEGGELYVSDAGAAKVRMVDTQSFNIETFAGTGTPGSIGDGGPATAAQLFTPTGLAADQSGDVLIAELDAGYIRKVEGDRPVGLLRVTTSPAVPADIYVDGVRRDSWALTWLELPIGMHDVCLSAPPGLSVSPVCQFPVVQSDQTTVIDFDFATASTLRVQTSPAVPSTIVVDGVPRNDWGVWTDVAPGNHQVCFGEVANFAVPPCQNVNVPVAGPANVTGVFTPSPGAPGPSGAFGYLRATTNPPVASQIIVDGQWRDTWGLTWMKMPTGTHTVCFQPLVGVAAPVCQDVVVNNGATTTLQGNFTQLKFLRVITSPAVPATIYVNGDRANTAGVWTPHLPGSKTVCFGPVPGFATPACQTVNLGVGPGTTTVTGAYTPS